MICYITQNGGFMFLIVCLWLSIINSSTSENTFTIQEYCSKNLYLHSIEPGERYTLILKSDTSSAKISKWYQKSKRKCIRDFKTSDPSSHFAVYISNMSIPSCSDCRCNYFEISVPSNTKRYCGNRETEYFSSKSDELSIEFHHGTTLAFDVTLIFAVERNLYIITGSPTEKNYGFGRFIETPYFPTPYPPNYRAEYILQSDSNSHVMLVFLDFLISNQSFIEVVGSNGTHPTRYYGSVFRPPVIVSQSNTLSIKFESSNQPGMPGFRALCSFVTNCGGQEGGLGGVMEIKIREGYRLYDCVWYITPALLPFTTSYLSVVIQLKRIGPKSLLEFRRGSNSKSDVVKTINCEIDDCSELKMETTVSASNDLYIRFNGYLESSYSVISMSYSIYHTGNCSENEFMCEDGRCLILEFRCDGIQQCPNGTDEQQCLTTKIPTVPVALHPGVKTDGLFESDLESDLVFKKFLLVAVVSSFGLISVICVTVIIFMCRYEKDPPDPVDGQPQVMREMMDAQSTLYSINRFDNDNLPSYDDFIKASESYPPILFTRSKRRFLFRDNCIQCTNFNQDARVRHHSDTSFNFKSSDADLFTANDEAVTYPQQGCSNSYDVEVYNHPTSKISKDIKRSHSLDSKLDNLMKHDTCHFVLSIMHPCNHTSHHCKHVQFHTLPINYKMNSFQTKKGFTTRVNPNVWPMPDSNGNYSKDRGITWSFAPHTAENSDVLTVVKSRCCSDPCKSISVHYSMY